MDFARHHLMPELDYGLAGRIEKVVTAAKVEDQRRLLDWHRACAARLRNDALDCHADPPFDGDARGITCNNTSQGWQRARDWAN